MPRFFEQPILNIPYEPPSRYHALDEHGRPLDREPLQGRRPSKFVAAVPKPRKRKGGAPQGELDLPTYSENTLINEIRGHVESWRALPNPADWGVTPTTQRLLLHWRTHQFEGLRPFFCQVEAVETAIWLHEVARPRGLAAGRRTSERKGLAGLESIWGALEDSNKEANPELFRIALKMATGAGKTTVMAMLVAWQALNAARSQSSKQWSRGFLIVTPGVTIRDRLQVLLPEHPDSYFTTRELIPPDLVGDIGKAKIVITNYHAFKRREELEVSKVGRALLQGRGDAPVTIESEGKMLQRACGDLLAMKNVVVINDEAHHCYRERQLTEEERAAQEKETAEEKAEARENNEAARLWISGIEALDRKLKDDKGKGGVRAVYDLSATPFFLRGSGYQEGSLFPWVVSDFSLVDAIESGIVKLPRVPVADNLATEDEPIYRRLWEHVGKDMPKKGAGKTGDLDPLSLPTKLQTALNALYSHYKDTYEAWESAGVGVPPVFIVVCNNTSSSKLVYEWIAGWERPDEDGERVTKHQGHLELFRNYDEHGNRLARPNTLLIDSAQLESGEALDPAFRAMAEPEIEQFKRELIARTGNQAAADKITDQDLLREVMNTVGRPGRLGEGIRCVVSVSMLTEGWDTNTVTHILGVRAFGTQLLCEQVVGRALRRRSYELQEDGLFQVEYADIMGIPFDFAAAPVKIKKPLPPKKTVRVHAVAEREALELVFPRVEGYRVELPEERLQATFTEDSRLTITPQDIGPTSVLMEGIVGEGVEITTKVLEEVRHSAIVFHLAKHLLLTRFRDHGQEPPLHLFGQIKGVARRWVEGGWLVNKSTPVGAVLYLDLLERAAEKIYLACQRTDSESKRVKAILDPYNPKGSTRHVSFMTSKDTWATVPDKSHVNAVVLDSSWEAELARCLERNPHVLAYVKNQGLGFEVPYRDGAIPRKYVPDFVVAVDDGRGGTLNLVLETKGYRSKDAEAKADTMKKLWVPGVNNLGTFGRWAFAEFTDVFEIQDKLDALIADVVGGIQ